jgi:Molecular chaperone (small heat shock protein)
MWNSPHRDSPRRTSRSTSTPTTTCNRNGEEVREQGGQEHGKYLRREFSYEKFQQTLLLPEDAEAEKIEAKVEHGVLNVHIPKKEKAQQPDTVKQIAVQ